MTDNGSGDFPLIFERSRPGRQASAPPRSEGPDLAGLLGSEHLRDDPPGLPEVSELDLVRHFTQLAHRQFSIDGNVYPLGSCTMKYNPKVHEETAKLFADLHPYQDPASAQGALELLHNLQQLLEELTGMDTVSLQPAAGAHGELTGMLMIRAFHEANGEGSQRRVVVVPDGAHGTNPATATMVGYDVMEVPTGSDGEVDFEAYSAVLGSHVAAVMLTNPNTLGIFETRIRQMADRAHAVGVQLYYDGANANAIVGRVRPGDMGFDVVHLNLHKTFTTPHGGGGPGTGPVGGETPSAPVPAGSTGGAHRRGLRPGLRSSDLNRARAQLLRKLRKPGPGLYLHSRLGPRRARAGIRNGRPQRKLPARQDERGGLRGTFRPHQHARIRGQATRRHQNAGPRQGHARPRRSPDDGLLSADRAGGDDGRTYRNRIARIARRLRRGASAGIEARPERQLGHRRSPLQHARPKVG